MIIILDEPTNHIYIAIKEVLEKSISNYKGTFVFVSRDRFFVNKFAGKIIQCDGNYDYYKEKKNEINLK